MLFIQVCLCEKPIIQYDFFQFLLLILVEVNHIFSFQSLESKFRRGNMSWFPWKTMSFLLLVSTAAIINADIQKHGGKFEKSNVGIFLQDIGQYDRLLILSQVILV